MKQTISNHKDPGALHFCDQTLQSLSFERCVLSMSGASSRSRFERCGFKDITLNRCTAGHPIFERCHFENVTATETITLYEALFIECQFAGRLTNLNFGSIRGASPFFDERRFLDDVVAIEKATFCLDITAVSDLDECAFIGDVIARKIRFRPGQGLLLQGKRLDVLLQPLLKSTNDFGLAVVLAGAVGFGSQYDLHFCAIPTELEHNAREYATLIRSQGVEVFEEPLN